MTLEPWQWALAVVGALAIGLAKTGISGLGMLAVVIFANLLPARQASGFVLPMLQRLSSAPPAAAPANRSQKKPIRALILTPTRELAAQIEESVRVYGKYAKQTSMVPLTRAPASFSRYLGTSRSPTPGTAIT